MRKMYKMTKRYIFINFLFIILVLFSAAALTGCTVPENGDGKVRVTCTVFPQYYIAKRIGGDRISLSMILKQGADSHNYEPTPADIIAAGKSDVFITVGGIGDIWIEKVLPSVSDNGGIDIIKLMDCVEAVEEEIAEGMQEEPDGENENEYDEHVWTSPVNMILIAEKICDALIENDSVNEEFYTENLVALTSELKKLDADIREITENAVRKTLVFGDRFAFRYFTEEYGLDYSAAFPGCSTDTDASAGTVAFLIEKVRSEDIPVVYYLENGTKKIADTVCGETGAEAVMLNSCHTAAASADYIELMYENLENIKKGLY